MNRRHIVVRNGRHGPWRDVLVEERPITAPFRHRRLHEDEPSERLIERGDELIGIVAGDRRRFRLHIRDDGARTWIPIQ